LVRGIASFGVDGVPGGVRQDRVVDAAGRIGRLANSGSAGSICSFQYARDASGNPVAAIANGRAGVLEDQSQLFEEGLLDGGCL
jgi:hypothetical protein